MTVFDLDALYVVQIIAVVISILGGLKKLFGRRPVKVKRRPPRCEPPLPD